MGKRYGRNQKRKAREQIAALEQQGVSLNRRLDERNDIVNRANEVLDLLYTIAPHSVIFQPQKIHEYHWRFDATYHPPMCVSFDKMAPMEKTFVMRTVDLFDLETTMIDNNIGDHIHFKTEVRNQEGCVVASHCRISWPQLQIETFESLRSRISNDLTRHLQQGISNVRR